MVVKEWWEARWKFALAALAILAFVALAPRPYGAMLQQAEVDARMIEAELASPEEFIPPEAYPPGYTRASYEERMRDEVEQMRHPDYPKELAEYEVKGVHDTGKYMFLVPLAALLGVALVSGEVGRGSIFLLLSKPVSRTLILLTKYCVGTAVLFAAALLGGVGILVSGLAHGYPTESLNVAQILTSSGMFWLATLSVLSVATFASVLLRDVIRSVIATVAALYVVFALPDLIRGVEWWLSPPSRDAPEVRTAYESFDVFDITRYWSITNPYETDLFQAPYALQQPDPTLSVLVCLVTALLPLLAALWLFRRRSY